MLKRTLLTALLALHAGAALLHAEAETPPAPAAEATTQLANKPVKDPTAQLRGKLLYKKSQSRKLEKTAEQSDPALKTRIAELHAVIEAAYVAANPKLAEIYQEQKELNERIDNLAAANPD